MISYRLPTADGWRYGISHRCRRTPTGWLVQQWAGAIGEERWVTVATDLCTYAEARQVAS